MTKAAEEVTNWLTLYQKAILEPDPEKLKVRIAEAQRAIRSRALELWYCETPNSGERRQMDAAFRFLRMLSTMGSDK